jgi:hypothetical protein
VLYLFLKKSLWEADKKTGNGLFIHSSRKDIAVMLPVLGLSHGPPHF